MNHIQISIEAEERDQEVLISELSGLDASGFEQTSTHLLAYFDEAAFNSYKVSEILKGFLFKTITVPMQNWNEVWEKSFEPVIVEKFCAIRAHFHLPITDAEHEIIITPKMSFGTGHHATTYMMVQQMAVIEHKGKKVFDFGTGTGILAILAAKLGAASVKGIDIDSWSIENATENAERNGCLDIEFSLSQNLPEAGQFDIVLANINRNVILQYISGLKDIVITGGTLLLSGLLTSDADDIVTACRECGFNFLKSEEKSGWVSLLFVKQK